MKRVFSNLDGFLTKKESRQVKQALLKADIKLSVLFDRHFNIMPEESNIKSFTFATSNNQIESIDLYLQNNDRIICNINDQIIQRIVFSKKHVSKVQFIRVDEDNVNHYVLNLEL